MQHSVASEDEQVVLVRATDTAVTPELMPALGAPRSFQATVCPGSHEACRTCRTVGRALTDTEEIDVVRPVGRGLQAKEVTR